MGTLGWLAVGVVIGVAASAWLPLLAWGWACVALVAVGCGVVSRWVGPVPVFAGFAIGLLAVAATPPGPPLVGVVAVHGVVAGASLGRTSDVVVSRWAHPGEGWHGGQGRVRARFPSTAPAPGTEVLLRGRAGPLWGGVLPGDPDPVRAARRTRVRAEVRVDRWAPIGGVGPRGDPFGRARHAGVLEALVTGDRARVDPQVWSLLRRSGTAHLLAISGFHVGLVGLAAAVMVRQALRCLAAVRPSGVPSGVSWWVGAGVGVAYALFVGAPPSALRAAGVLLLVAGARASGRSVEPMRLLAVVAATHVLADPGAISTPGFQLSYGAALGLLRVTPRLLAWVPPDVPWAVRWLANSVAATVGATVGTLPGAAWWFQDLAPLGVPANLLALPAVAVGVVPCAVLAVVAPEPVAGLALSVADGVLSLLFAGLEPLAVAPLHPAVGPAGALLLLALVVAPRRPGLCLWALLVALGLRPVAPAVWVPALSTGHAVLVEHPDGRRWLVVDGPPNPRVVGWLRRRGVRRIDVLVAGERDRGQAALVSEELAVGQVWAPDHPGAQAWRWCPGTGPPGVDAFVAGIDPSASLVLHGAGPVDVSAWRAGRGWLSAGTHPSCR